MYNFIQASVDAPTLEQKIEDLNTAAMSLLTDGGVTKFTAATEWRGEAAALVREAVVDTFRMTDPTGIFCEVRQLQHGQTYKFDRVFNTLRVVEYSHGSDPQIFTPVRGEYGIATSTEQLNYGIDLEAMINGQWQIGDFVSMAAEALLRRRVEAVLAPVDLASQQNFMGDPLRTLAAGADVAKAEIDAALRRMYKYNSGVTILGTPNALYPLGDLGAAMGGDASKEELLRRGFLGAYRGAKIVAIEDDYNEYYETFTKVNGLDLSNLLFLVSGQKGAVFLEKDLSMLDWEVMDPRSARWEQGIRFETGTLVHSPYRFHVIELDS